MVLPCPQNPNTTASLNYSSKDKTAVRAGLLRLQVAMRKPLRVWLHDCEFRPQNPFALRTSKFGLPAGLEHFLLLACPAEASARRRRLKLKGLKARKKTAQGKRSETSAALGQRIEIDLSPEGAKENRRALGVSLVEFCDL